MRRAKRRIFSGVVCEQIVFSIPDRLKNLDKAEPRPRFKNEAEREAHKIAISRRKHNELFNENFSPTSLYSTLTLDIEHLRGYYYIVLLECPVKYLAFQ